jgi:uncharacterized membrane protein
VTFDELMTRVGQGVEAAGVIVLILGLIAATARFALRLRRGARLLEAYRGYRREIGRLLLLCLEFLIAGDIIHTIATTPSLYDVGVLAAIVLIRTFLSFSLELEIDGRWPWQARPSRAHDE